MADGRYGWVPGGIKKLFTFPLAFLYLGAGRESDHLSVRGDISGLSNYSARWRSTYSERDSGLA